MTFALSLFRAADTVTFVRRLMAFDAATCVGMGLMLVAGAGILGPLLNLPEPLLRAAGFALFPYAIGIAFVAARAAGSRPAVLAVAIANAVWVIGTLGILFSGQVSPNIFGLAFVAAQAVFVGVLAELQVIGAKRLAAG